MAEVTKNLHGVNALARAAQFFSSVLKDAGTGEAIVDQAIAVNANSFEARRIRCFASVFLGQHEPAIEQFQRAMRLNPLDPQTFRVEHGLAMANFFMHRFEIALSWETKSVAHQRNFGPSLRWAMFSYAMLDRIADAQMMRARLREAGADMTISQIKKWTGVQRREDVELMVEACRIAGVPE